MAKTVAIGIQDFGDLIQKKCFYVDKTDFIREWWQAALRGNCADASR